MTLAMPLVRSIVEEVRETYRFRRAVMALVYYHLKFKYRRSVLGFLWTMIIPLLNYLIMGFVFSLIARASTPDYFLHLFAGAVLFNLISATSNTASLALLSNEHYIRKVPLPKSVFILSTVGIEVINFTFALIALLILGLVLGQIVPSTAMLFLPVPIIITVVFLVGVASFVSVVTVFLRDVQHLVPVVMQVLFFGTPILYTFELVPERFRPFLFLNPILYFVEGFRQPLLTGTLPKLSYVAIAAGTALFAAVVGLVTLKRMDNRILFKI